MSFEAKRAALDFRSQATGYYRTLRLREPLLERELQRTQFRLTAERTVREIEEVLSNAFWQICNTLHYSVRSGVQHRFVY